VVAHGDVSLLELVDHVLTKGVVLSGEITLGLADVELIYVRLLALICAADRAGPSRTSAPSPKHRRRR
jgi:hypothetical protein